MSFTVVALIGWIPLCALLFAVMTPLRACVLAFIIGWLALPMASIDLPGMPDIDKVLATSLGAAIGMTLFCNGIFRGFRPCLADGLVVLFAVSTYITSVDNELGGYDGASSIFRTMMQYGVPFLFGRAFLKTRQDLLTASRYVVTAAAIYGLLALWEWRMSPQIHNILYGFFPHGWNLGPRWGFYRPILCSPSTLALGAFFSWTALLAVWLYRAKLLRPISAVPTWVIGGLPVVGLLTSMSFGPWGMFLAGLGLLWLWGRMHWRRAAMIPALFALVWMVGRFSGATDGKWMTEGVARLSEQRSLSLQYRIDAEDIYLNHAKAQPWFGWGTHGRNRPTDAQGKSLMASDGLWIIYVSAFGVVGLSLFYLWWCWPLLAGVRFSRIFERDPPAMVLLVTIGLQASNFLFNAFLDPILTMLCGGVMTQLEAMRRQAAGAAYAPTPPRSARRSMVSETGGVLRVAK